MEEGKLQINVPIPYPEFTNIISSLALNLIIFTGGFHTGIKRIKPAMVAGYAIENASS